MKNEIRNQRGYFSGECEYELTPFDNIDYHSRLFLFGGQGAAAPGMFRDLFLKHKSFQELFKLADQICANYKIAPISRFILDASHPVENYSTTERSVALFVTQVAVTEVLVKKGLKPHAFTGHSFGEYAALTCSGILEFEQALNLIINREDSKYKNQLGFMFAAKTDLQKMTEVQKLCPFEISNINSDDQIVISVSCEQEAELRKVFKSQKIPHIKIDTEYPYHSSYIAPAIQNYVQYIDSKKINIKAPHTPMISSVTHEMITVENFDSLKIISILKNQMIYPVNFVRQIAVAKQNKFNHFVEIGPHKLLTEFVHKTKIAAPCKAEIAQDYFDKNESTSKAVKTTKNSQNAAKFIPFFNKALKFVTGYEIESIQVEDRLQEDLGIDSIRKAEIIFKVFDDAGLSHSMKEQSIRVSEISTVSDILEYFALLDFQNSKETGKTQDVVADAPYTYFKPQLVQKEIPPLIKFLNRHISSFDVEVKNSIDDLVVGKNNLLSFLDIETSDKRIIKVHFSNQYNLKIENGSKDFQQSEFKKVINYFADLNLSSYTKSRDIYFIFVFSNNNTQSLFSRTVRSFLKTWSVECGDISSQMIEILDATQVSNEELIANHLDGNSIFIQYKNKSRFIEKLEKTNEIPIANNQAGEKFNTVLMIGGLSGIGFEISQSEEFKKFKNIYIMGRRSEQNSDVSLQLKKLRQTTPHIQYIQCDVTDYSQIEASIQNIIKINGVINLIINSSGLMKNTLLHQSLPAQRSDEFDAKFLAINNLQQIFKMQPAIAHVVSFSSNTGYYWNPGQSVYAMANSYVDQIAEMSHQQFQARQFQSVRWPPWQNVGMISDSSIQSLISFTGLTYLPIKEGIDFFWSSLHSSDPVITILEESSKLRYFMGGVDKKMFRQFLSALQSPFTSSQLLLSGLTLTNLPYLRDHCLNGRPIMAASNMIALFMQMGYAIWGQIPQALNFIGHNFVFVNEDESQVSLIMNRSTDKIQFQMKSHFINSEGEVKIPQISEKMIISKKPPKTDSRLNTEFLTGTIIEVERSFNFSDTYLVNSQTQDIVVQFDPRKIMRSTEMPLYDFTFSLIEICNQAIGLSSQWKYNYYAIPKSIQKITLNENVEITTKMYSHQGNVRSEENQVFADAYITNDKDEVVLLLENVCFSSLGHVADSKGRFVLIS